MLMSGAAGLAAAKRRRAAATAATTAPPPPKARTSRTTLKPSPTSDSPQQQQPPPATESKLTPLQALNQHDSRIKELEASKTDASATERLGKEIDELKQTILKMQTFAIEQSLELTKLKKNMITE